MCARIARVSHQMLGRQRSTLKVAWSHRKRFRAQLQIFLNLFWPEIWYVQSSKVVCTTALSASFVSDWELTLITPWTPGCGDGCIAHKRPNNQMRYRCRFLFLFFSLSFSSLSFSFFFFFCFSFGVLMERATDYGDLNETFKLCPVRKMMNPFWRFAQLCLRFILL